MEVAEHGRDHTASGTEIVPEKMRAAEEAVRHMRLSLKLGDFPRGVFRYGVTVVMNVPQFAKGTKVSNGDFAGMTSAPIQMLPASSETAHE